MKDFYRRGISSESLEEYKRTPSDCFFGDFAHWEGK